MTSGNAAILPEILRRIVDAYRPAQVYLFGSEARGDAGSDSDIDLAVIVRDDAPERQSTPRMAAEALWGLERGADIVRVHDVKEMRRVCIVADAVVRGRMHAAG